MLLHFLTILITIAAICSAESKNCDKSGILIYEDLGCTSTSTDTNGCPNNYNCLGLRKNDQCYFRGKPYKDGDLVDRELSNPGCNVGCYCATFENNPKFICAALDCPEWLGAPIQPNCYRKYSLNQCCSAGQACPPFENVTCLVDGQEYREGERFYPKNTCLRCVCQKGFDGQFVEPFCKRHVCGEQLRDTQQVQGACAPVYSTDGDVICCPKTWTCPDGNESVRGKPDSDNVCMYGNQTLKVGQLFEKQIENRYGGGKVQVKCRCAIPPLLTCIEVK